MQPVSRIKNFILTLLFQLTRNFRKGILLLYCCTICVVYKEANFGEIKELFMQSVLNTSNKCKKCQKNEMRSLMCAMLFIVSLISRYFLCVKLTIFFSFFWFATENRYSFNLIRTQLTPKMNRKKRPKNEKRPVNVVTLLQRINHKAVSKRKTAKVEE